MTLYRDEASSCAPRSWARPTASSRCSPAGHGRVRAVAKGVRRTKSKFGGRGSSRSATSTLQLYVGRSLDIVTQVETLTAFGDRLAGDYPRYTAGTAMLETAERLTAEEREPALQLYLLLVGGLRALDGRRRTTPGLVLDAFLLRALAVAGYAPAFDDCARCGARARTGAFSVAGRRRGLRRLPPARLGHARRPRHCCCSPRCSPATGRPPTPASARRRARERPGRGVPAVAPRARAALAALVEHA